MNDELREKINQYIKQKIIENNSRYNEKELFLRAVYDTLVDVEENHSELFLANFESPAYDLRVDGFDFVNDNSIDLYLSLYSLTTTKMTEADLNANIARVTNFITLSRNDLYEQLPSSTIARELSEQIKYNYSKINNFRIIVVTNMEADFEKELSIKFGDKIINVIIYDLTSINELNVFENDVDDSVNIDLIENFGRTIPFIINPIDYDKFDTYLFFVPSLILAKIYEIYGYSFLSGNVRAYLKKTQKVNKAIYSTLENSPNLFVAYNNGLSTVASNIELDEKGNIAKIFGWQVVNGGQTTATIYEAYKSGKIDLSNAYVPVKMTLIKNINKEEVENLVSKISECANTQSKVDQSDFSSNEKYHIELEKYSKKICIPKLVRNDEFEKWYYERTKNQYDLNKSRDKTGLFAKEYPKDKKITKTDLAKGIMSWEQEPNIVSLGKEKNFYLFNTRIKSNEDFIKIDDDYYKKSIALCILFRIINEIVDEESFGGYKANVNYYVLSMISYLTERKLNLLKIWNDQDINNIFRRHICELAKLVYEKINETPENNTNVAMWCRTKECWENVKSIKYELTGIEDYICDEEIIMAPETTLIVLDDETYDLNNVTSAEWFALSKWGKETDLIQPRYRQMAYSTGVNIAQGKKLTTSQIAFAKKVLKDAYQKGFEYKEEE